MTPTYSKDRGFWEFPKSGQILTYKSAPQCIASKGKNLEAPESSHGNCQANYDSVPSVPGAEDSHGVGDRASEIEGGRGSGNDVVYTAGVQREEMRPIAGTAVGIGWVFLLFALFCCFL